MSDRIRFHLDENVNAAIARALRTQDIDVTLTPEVGLLGVVDEVQLAFAHEQNRVIVTHDADLLRLADQGIPHAGIVYSAKDTRQLRDMIRGLILIHQVLTPEDMQAHIEFL